LNEFDVGCHVGCLFGFHIDGQIRTPQFTQFTANTILGPGRNGFLLFVEFKDVLGTELDTYAASFAPAAIDVVLFQFGFARFGFYHSDFPLEKWIARIVWERRGHPSASL
jgi:hypothetical protein